MVGGNLIKVNGAKSFTIDIVLLLNVIRNYNLLRSSEAAKQRSSEALYKKSILTAKNERCLPVNTQTLHIKLI
jgi:hypothetical protein